MGKRKNSRDIELLVALFERQFGPSGTIVKSPDKIMGKLSGTMREIDITLRGPIGSSEILIMVECRDRSRKQGVDWLEHVAKKLEDVGADKAMVVSSKGFWKDAIQYAKEGIRANSIHPGTIETPMTADLLSGEGRQDRINRTPLRRLGRADDVAYGALYLASDEASFVTGSELVIDGGRTAE